MSRIRIPRRTFLRGLGGTAIALPWLEAMIGDAHAGSGGVPCRYVVCFAGTAMGTDGDSSPNGVVPDRSGPAYDPATDLNAGLTPLLAAGVEREVTVVSGLQIPTMGAPGGRAAGDSFHFHVNPMLTGHTQIGGQFGTDVTGESSDQIVARALAGDTTFESLQLRVQALYYSTPGGIDIPNNRDTLSFRDMGGGNFGAIPPYSSPRQAYDALFAGFMPTDPAEAAARAFQLSQRKSALDLVDRRMNGLLGRLGTVDQQRMQRHYDEIRDLERRLDAMAPDVGGACALPPDPGQDPPLGGEPPGPDIYDSNLGYSGEEERAAAMTDILHMALTCDLTRSATLMYSMWQSFMNLGQLPGVNMTTTSHLLNHNGQTSELSSLIAWYSGHFANLIAKLRDTPEDGGSVLDNCAIVMLFEGGNGGDPDFGQLWSSHTTENMAALVAGRAGRLLPGQHIVAPAGQDHPVNVLLTAMNAVGVPTAAMGDVSGTIPGLTG